MCFTEDLARLIQRNHLLGRWSEHEEFSSKKISVSEENTYRVFCGYATTGAYLPSLSLLKYFGF